MAFAFAGQWGPEPVVDRYGNAIYSATFRVLTTAGAEATVYTDRTKATTVSQPLDVDGEANATFYAAPGRYTVELTAGGSVTSFPVGVVPDAEDVEPAPDVATQFAATAWRTGRLVYDVTDAAYGAVGDGVADDTTAIQAAIDACENAGGGMVWFPTGTYKTTATLTANEPNGVMLFGASRDTAIEPTGASIAGVPVLKFINARRSGLANMTVRGNSTNVPSAIIEVRSAARTKGHAPSGFKAQHVTLGSTSLSSSNYGIRWTYDATYDLNNDLGLVEDCSIINVTTAYRIEGENSLLHQIIGGSVGGGVTNVISFQGGSAKLVGLFAGSHTGWYVDIEDATYNHAIMLAGCSMEGGGSLLRASALAESVNVLATACDFDGGSASTTLIDFRAADSVVTFSGCYMVPGQPSTVHHYTSATSRAKYVGCRLGATTLQWEGSLALVSNYHNPGTVALTQGTSATLVQVGDEGGGFAAGRIRTDGDVSVGGSLTASNIAGPRVIVPPVAVKQNTGDAAWFAANYSVGSIFYVPVTKTYRYANWRIGTSSGNIQVCVLALSGPNMTTFTRVMNSGVIAAPAAGVVRIDLGATELQAGGLYALMFWTDNTTITVPHTADDTTRAARISVSDNTGAGGIGASGTLTDGPSTRYLPGLTLEAE